MNILARDIKHQTLVSAFKKDGDTQALAEIIKDYKPFYKKAVSKIVNSRILGFDHYQDLIQECHIATLKAIYKFDSDKGTKITPFLITYVNSALKRYVLDFQKACRLGTNTADRKAYYSAHRLRAKKQSEVGSELTNEDIQKISNDAAVPLKTAREVVQVVSNATVAIDKIEYQAEAIDYISEIEDNQAKNQAFEMFEKLKYQLDDRTRDIICASFLSHHISGTIKKLAEKHNLTPRRVRQIQKQGLNELKTLMQDQGVLAEDIL